MPYLCHSSLGNEIYLCMLLSVLCLDLWLIWACRSVEADIWSAVCCLMGFLSLIEHCLCACTDKCLSCVRAQLRWGCWGCCLADALRCSIPWQQFHSQRAPCKALSADIISYSQMDSQSAGRMQFQLNWKAQFGQPDRSFWPHNWRGLKIGITPKHAPQYREKHQRENPWGVDRLDF